MITAEILNLTLHSLPLRNLLSLPSSGTELHSIKTKPPSVP